MRRRRVTGRFYIFLILILAIVFLIVRPYLPFGDKEAVISMASSEYTQSMDAVIIRDESVYSSNSIARIEYVATEGTLLDEGDIIAYLYSTGYSENELKRLETIRADIQAYHKSVLANIVDSQLQRLDTIVNMKALEFKSLVTRKTTGNLLTLTRQLETAMVNRQEYMRQNKREDLKLNKLYEDENTRLNSISSWRTDSTAGRRAVVSFYLDGYESAITFENLNTLTNADVKTVLAGGKFQSDEPSRMTGIYRLVNQDKWYVAILTDGKTWNPVLDQEYSLQMDGFADLTYTAKVMRVQKTDNEVLAIFEINDPIGPLIYQRTGKVSLSSSITALSVNSDAIYNQNGQLGVWLFDVPGGTFVAVDVLLTDNKYSMIRPLVDGALQLGQKVLIKK